LFLIGLLLGCSNSEEFASYHKNGNLKTKGFLVEDRKHGKWFTLLENGDTSIVEYYINGRMDSSLIHSGNGYVKSIYEPDSSITVLMFEEQNGENFPSTYIYDKDSTISFHYSADGTLTRKEFIYVGQELRKRDVFFIEGQIEKVITKRCVGDSIIVLETCYKLNGRDSCSKALLPLLPK